jgi:serpin B
MNSMMMKKTALTLSMFGALACGGGGEEPGPDPDPNEQQGDVVRSELARQTPDVPAANAEELVEGNTAFALDMYAKSAADGGNVMTSPYSVSIALAMLYAGARNETEAQMADALHYTLPQDDLHEAFNGLDLELESRETPASPDAKPFQMSIANAIWGQRGYPFEADYLDTLALNYGAGLRPLDFQADPEAARQTINKWVEGETAQRIKDLLPEGSITASVVLVLTNAIYFKASWASPFEESATAPGGFDIDTMRTVQVDMMTQQNDYGYAEVGDVEVVELDYDGREMSMVLLIPELGGMAALESSLDVATLDGYLDAITNAYIDLTIPKFEFETEFQLGKALQELGMVDAFTGAADLSGIDGTTSLSVFEVYHKTFVAVDEEGTEAAAATAVVVGETSVPVVQATVRADRPFIFLIRDKATGAIVFMGRVEDPS